MMKFRSKQNVYEHMEMEQVTMNMNWDNQKPKREITKITNRHNTMKTHGKSNGQPFSKRWPLTNSNRTKSKMNTRKAKRRRNSDTIRATAFEGQ